jgi:hypothetical protein
VIAYRATLDVPRELAWFASRLLAAERLRRGTPRSSRALTCFWQAALGLRWFRDRTSPDALARGHGISRATAYRYLDEVIVVLEQIIEPAARILDRPKVQLGLHPPYPLLRRIRIRPDQRLTSVHQRLQPLQSIACMNPLGPFAMPRLSRARTSTGPPPHPAAIGGRRANPPPAHPDGRQRTGTTRWFPRSP